MNAATPRPDDHRLPGWDAFDFTDDTDGRRHPFYRRGRGPGVMVIHEIPGITPQVTAFAERVVDEGFTVVMPSLFGEPGRPKSGPYVGTALLKACVSREFVTWLTGRTSAATIWLRRLARLLHDDVGGPGVGVVGMCITGGFALAMAVDESVIAPVMSQPSLPFSILPSQCRDLNLSPDDRAALSSRLQANDITVLGLRFTQDWRVKDARFQAVKDLLGPHFREWPIASGKGTPFPKGAHSVLTYDGECTSREKLDQAAEEVVKLLNDKLCQP